MTRGSILRLYLICLASVGNVLGGVAGHSQGMAPPAAEEGASVEQVLFISPVSDKDHTALSPTHLTVTVLPATDQENLSVFERYITGLGRLLAALQDSGHNWEAQAHVPSAAPEAKHHETADFRDKIQKLFALAGTMKRLSGAIKQKYPDDGEAEMQDNRRAEDPAIVSPGAEAAPSSGLHSALSAAVTDLLRLFDQYFGSQSGEGENISEEEGREEEKRDSIQVLVETLDALAEAHTNYTVAITAARTPIIANLSTGGTDRISDSSSLPLNSPSFANPRGDYASAANITPLPAAAEASTRRPLGWHDNQRGLLQVATQLKALLRNKTLGGDGSDTVPLVHPSVPPSIANTATTSTTVTSRSRGASPSKQPCFPPFELIAYRMCILQEMQLKLSWSDAQEFCRERGAELAQDMTVIKTRRFLNGLYGEDGTRSRWPVWVGGRRVEQTWRWAGDFEQDLEVPAFLWAPYEPRGYSSDLMPKGLCMILDGYRRFYGASLPCHLRRRFICQLQD